MQFAEEVDLLTQLGFTVCQAKVYLALVRSGPSSASSISENSCVSRPDVYRILPSLQQMGLVEKELVAPVRFRATPISETLPSFIRRKIDETEKIKTATEEFLMRYEEKKDKDENPNDDCQFSFFQGKVAYANKIRGLIEKSKESIDTICPPERSEYIYSAFGKAVIKVIKRGVRSRLIMEKNKDRQLCKVYSEVKFVSKQIPVAFSIYDKKQVVIVSSPMLFWKKSGALLSTNSSIIELAQTYFEDLWNSSSFE